MAKLSDLREQDKELTVPIGSSKVVLTYTPSEYTISDLEAVEKRPKEERLTRFAEMVVETIKKWDIEHNEPEIIQVPAEGDGEPTTVARTRYIDLSVEEIKRHVPVRILAALLREIQKDIAPDPEA